MKKIHLIISNSQEQKLKSLIPSRMRSLVMRCVLDLIIKSVENYGPGILGLIISNEIKLAPGNHSMRENLTHTDKVEKDGQQKAADKVS